MDHPHRLVVVLVRTEGAWNLGSVARLCGNYDCELRLVDVGADSESREAVMMAHPSVTLLCAARRFQHLAEAVCDVDIVVGTSSKLLEARDHPALDVEAARKLRPTTTSRTAVVFGNEREGLTRAEGACCHRVLRLPTTGSHESLNLSHAVAVVLATFSLARLAPDCASAAATERQQLVEEWLRALEKGGFFQRSSTADFAPRLRVLLDRWQLTSEDVALVRGMLRVWSKAD